MEISNIAFVNFTGYVAPGAKGGRTAALSCSTLLPCYNIALKEIGLSVGEGGAVSNGSGLGTCAYVESGGISGLTGAGC